MNLQIYLYGQPVLRKETLDIEKTYEEFEALVANMFETMYKAEGVGLAAPQVGLPIRLFVIDGDPLGEDFPECKGLKSVFSMHQLTAREGDKVTMEEGCLSLPGVQEGVTRYSVITIKYLDENFEEKEETFGGFAARIVQHEYDHLEGKVVIDHISPRRKQLIQGKLNNILKVNVRCT